MAFEVKVSGASRRLRVSWAEVAGAWADQVQPVAKAALKRAAPVGQGPGAGRLRDSITAKRTVSAAELVLTFTSSAPYAGYVIGGTREHPIDSKGEWPLRNRVTGQVFGRHVIHPATAPNRFPERALGPLAAEFRARLEALLAEQLSE
jgi:hypothetical protein